MLASTCLYSLYAWFILPATLYVNPGNLYFATENVKRIFFVLRTWNNCL